MLFDPTAHVVTKARAILTQRRVVQILTGLPLYTVTMGRMKWVVSADINGITCTCPIGKGPRARCVHAVAVLIAQEEQVDLPVKHGSPRKPGRPKKS